MVVLLGILAAIALPSWFGFIEGRNAASAANQVTADLRLAHSTARNRLENVRVERNAGNPNCYSIVGTSLDRNRCLPRNARLSSFEALSFKASGEVTKADGSAFSGPQQITVLDGRGNPAYTISINTQTSRVKVD